MRRRLDAPCSEHLGRERDDLHEPLRAQLARHRPEDAGADRLAGVVDQHGRVGVEADVGAVGAPDLLRRPHDDRLHHLALLHLGVRDRLLHRDDDDVADRGVLALAAPEHLDAEHLARAASCRRRRARSPTWIMPAPRPDRRLGERLVAAEDREHRPALVARQRARLDDAHAVADVALVRLVVRLVARAPAQVLVVPPWRTRRSTGTTTVLSILSDTTTPSRSLRLPSPGVACSSAPPRAAPVAGVRSRSSVFTRASVAPASRASSSGFGSCAVAPLQPEVEHLVGQLALARRAARPRSGRCSSRSFMPPPPRAPTCRSRIWVGSDSFAAASCSAPRAAVALDAFHLEEHAAGLDDRDPHLGRALALAHARLGRLLGERLVGEHAHPHAPAALDGARERDAGGLDLARREPAAVERLQAVVAERERRAAPGRALAAALLHLAPLDLLRLRAWSRPRHDAERGALLLLLPRQHLAAEDPHLHADDAVAWSAPRRSRS